jgi:hypothetical protein
MNAREPSRVLSLIQSFLLAALREVAPPIRLVRKGRLPYLVYLCVFCGIAWWISEVLQNRLHLYVALIERDQGLSEETVRKLRLIATVSARLVPIPLVLTGIVLPVRILFMHGDVRLRALSAQTVLALRLSIQSALWTARSLLLYGVFPLLIVYAVYHALINTTFSVMARDAFWVATALLMATIVARGIPILLSPILSVTAGYEARYALQMSHIILRSCRLRVAVILIAGIAALFLVTHLLREDPAAASAWVEPLRWSCNALIVWFTLSLSAHHVLFSAYHYELLVQQTQAKS